MDGRGRGIYKSIYEAEEGIVSQPYSQSVSDQYSSGDSKDDDTAYYYISAEEGEILA
jgi:hypothetical protein